MKKITLIAYSIVACLMTIVVINNLDPWRPTPQEIESLTPNMRDGVYTPVPIPVVPVAPSQTNVSEALASIQQNDLKQMVTALASQQMDGRLAGTPGCQAAANYIEKVLKNVGLKTMRDPFQWDRKTTENVYGWIEGHGQPNEIVVVGAHYDHLGPGRPGADDNASGTSGVLEVARAFAKIQPLVQRTMVFQLYSAEEYGLYGSNHYCRNPKFPQGKPSLRQHVFMMNMDMIGYMGKQTSYHRAEDAPSPVDALVNQLSLKYPFAKQITFKSGNGSDHANFHRYSQGTIPVAWLFTGTHSNYHRPTDTADKLNYEGMEKICRYAFELLYLVQKQERSIPQIKTVFVDTPDLYDHNDPNTPYLQN